MADLLPTNFPIPAEPAISSYDFIDFAGGFGYKKLYFSILEKDVGAGAVRSAKLVSEVVESSQPFRTLERSTAGTTSEDFDITFLNPVTIEGTGIVRFLEWAVGGTLNLVSVTTTIKKVSASTTEIGSVTTDQVSLAQVHVKTAPITITKTVFAVGDILRVTVEIEVTGSGTGAGVSLDPSGRTSMTETTTGATVLPDSYILIPLRIQL